MITVLATFALTVVGARPSDRVRAEEILTWSPPLNVSSDFRERDGKARGLLPPTAICQGTLERAEWSPDSARLLLVRHVSAPGEPTKPTSAELLVHELKSGRTTSYWTFDPSQVKIEAMNWLPGSGTVVITTSWPAAPDPTSSLVMLNPRKPRVYLFDPSRNVSTTVFEGRYAERVRVLVSHNQPLGVVDVKPPEGEATLLLFGANGPTGALPNPAKGGILTFDQTGRHLLVSRSGGDKLRSSKIDLASGRRSDAPDLAPYLVRPVRPDVTLEWRSLPAEVAKHGPRGILYCRSQGHPQAEPIVVGADSDPRVGASAEGAGSVPSVAPDGSAILYRSQGLGLVRRFVTLPQDRYRELLAQWLRYQAMRDCAQAFVTLEDVHANTPGLESQSLQEWVHGNPRWSSRTRERLGDPAVTSRFTFTPATATKDAGGGMLGTSTTPAGTARLFATGLIEWIPNPEFAGR